MTASKRPTPPEIGKKWVIFTWRDKRIQSEDIPEEDIPLRYQDCDSPDLLLEFLETAEPGDTFPLRGERVLRYR
jgi:hypothetical protein